MDQINLDCLRKAQRGCKESRSLLAQQAKPKVYTFINRMTLDHDLSEDLCLSRANGTTVELMNIAEISFGKCMN